VVAFKIKPNEFETTDFQIELSHLMNTARQLPDVITGIICSFKLKLIIKNWGTSLFTPPPTPGLKSEK
jgi:hypothetical protein